MSHILSPPLHPNILESFFNRYSFKNISHILSPPLPTNILESFFNRYSFKNISHILSPPFPKKINLIWRHVVIVDHKSAHYDLRVLYSTSKEQENKQLNTHSYLNFTQNSNDDTVPHLKSLQFRLLNLAWFNILNHHSAPSLPIKARDSVRFWLWSSGYRPIQQSNSKR